MDTVLGLSLTPTTVGLVLADGDDVDGTALAVEEITLEQDSTGLSAVNASTQAAAAVSRVQAMVEAQGQRLHGIGLTWSAAAAAEAALLLESLAVAGLDNVVPVRFQQAAESLSGAAAPADEAAPTAVCVVEPGSATVLTMSGRDGAPGVVQHPFVDDDELVAWLTGLFPPDMRRPGVIVVTGSGADVESVASRLQAELALPVVGESAAQLALAHGAALALEPGFELTQAFPEASTDASPELASVSGGSADRMRPGTLGYAGVVTMLVLGVITFVVSLSITLSLELAPTKDDGPVHQVAQAPAAPARPNVRRCRTRTTSSSSTASNGATAISP